MKRKLDSDSKQDAAGKRLKLTDDSHSNTVLESQVTASNLLKPEVGTNTNVDIKNKGKNTDEDKDRSKPQDQGKGHQRLRINKLAPPRPFPTVPTSVSATGPRSSHKEGKNLICVTRKTPLARYLTRCKDVIIKDGYKTLYLSAMGAAIPLLLQLTCALPPILPFSQDEIHTEVITGTVEVQDELLPEDDDEDITYQTRGKSTLRIVFKIGDGAYEGDKTGSRKYAGGKGGGKAHGPSRNGGKKRESKSRNLG